MRKNLPIRKAKIRANEHAERLLAAKRIFGIGEQDNSLDDPLSALHSDGSNTRDRPL